MIEPEDPIPTNPYARHLEIYDSQVREAVEAWLRAEISKQYAVSALVRRDDKKWIVCLEKRI